MALGVHGFVDGANHILVGTRHCRYIGQHFCDCLAGDSDAVAVQQAGGQQGLHDLGNATGIVQVHCQVLAAGFKVAQHRGFDAHAFKVVNGPFHFSGVGNGQEVQHGVGRTTGGHDHGHGVFNGFSRHDIARLQVFFDGLDQHFGGLFGRIHFLVVRVGHG